MVPRPLQIRVPQNCWHRIQQELSRTTLHHEPVLFAFVSCAVTATRDLVLVREVIVPPDTAFVKTRAHGAQWTAKYNLELLNRCLDAQHGLLILHRHHGCNVRMSRDDVDSARRLLPRFQYEIPLRAHASIVLGDRSVDGLVWMPSRNEPVSNFEFRVLDAHMTTLPFPPHDELDARVHRRQPLAITALSRKLLGRTRVAIVGLSGGGTQLATQLAAGGVGELIGIDYQRLDGENQFSTDAVTWVDLARRRTKLAAIRRRVWWVNPRCRFSGISSRVPEQKALDALKTADVIVGCVNNLAARTDILEVAGRYCIPYIDIGLTVRTADDGPDPAPIVAVTGHVFSNVPGGPCFWCAGYLTKRRLEIEAEGIDRSYLWNRRTDRPKREVLVAGFNGVLANQAACDVLQMVLGYVAPSSCVVYKMYDGFAGTLTDWEVSRRDDCHHCSGIVSSGDPIWS